MAGLYVHIPFCRQKCLYCDFYTGGARIADWPVFVNSLVTELSMRAGEIDKPFSTLYFGGGTPSLIPLKDFTFLTKEIRKFSGNQEDWDEFTIEANPEDITDEKCHIWKEEGVNRLSIGIQSFNDAELKKIGRNHNVATALESIEIAKRHFGNISLDLMFGLPMQTPQNYRESLKSIIELNPDHISSYSLMLEEGTALTTLEARGEISLPDEEDWLEMYEDTLNLLTTNGYRRYEISNYALAGKESKHNMGYWTGQPYLGIGPGAHTYDGIKIRRANPNDIKGYLKFFSDNSDNIGANSLSDFNKKKKFYTEEILSDEEIKEETVFIGLRTAQGIDVTNFEKRFGRVEKERLLKESLKFLETGSMLFENGFLRLTEKGFAIYNKIASSLM